MKVFELIAKLEALPDRNAEVVINDTEYGFCVPAVAVSESQEPIVMLQIDEAVFREEMKIAVSLCR